MKPTFDVWAPRAWRVEVGLVDGPKLVMRPLPGGRFVIDADQITGPYQLHLDGGGPIPDPRAGDVASVHGPCFLVDHAAFTWTDQNHRPAPLEGAVLYELHVGTFTREGTFDGAAARLEALKALGVTHVELMPVAAFSGTRGWGYDGTALFAPHRAYGGVNGLKRFVDAAHRLGLNVVLDVVYNHLGPEGNYLAQLAPYFAEEQTPWGGATIDLKNPQVRRFFVDNALQWVRDYHVDGLRLDAVHAFSDLTFVADVKAAMAPSGAVIVAESDLNDPVVVQAADAQWSDDFHHALHVVLTGDSHGHYADFAEKPLTKLARALEEGFVYAGHPSVFRKRPHGKPLGDVPLWRLLAYDQTHDQVGNEAAGARIHVRAGMAGAKAALALTMMAPFTPMLFMGEEWAASSPFLFFSDHQDPSVGKATTEGRRREQLEKGRPAEEFSDPQAAATFEQSVLDWGERSRPPHVDMLRFTTAMIALRREVTGPGKAVVDEERGTLTYLRGEYVYTLNGPALPEGEWDPVVIGEKFAIHRRKAPVLRP